MDLATEADVEARLGRKLSAAEKVRVEGLLGEASALVEAHLRVVPTPVPGGIAIVTSRIVARVLAAGEIMPGATRIDETKGPFSGSVTYAEGSTSGGPWLSKQDRTMLGRWRTVGRAGSVDTASYERTRGGCRTGW